MTGPRGADGSLRANRFGSVAAMVSSRTAYVVALPDLPGGGGPAAAAEQLYTLLEHLALDWLDADAAPGEARLAGRQQRLVEQTADGELVARLLAEPGVDPNAAADFTEPHGETSNCTPLTHAVGWGHLDAARLLLEAGADPSRADGGGRNPLMLATGEGHLEVLQLLLMWGVAVDAAHPSTGGTAFHIACYHNHPDCVEALVRAGCDVRLKVRKTPSWPRSWANSSLV